MRSGNFDRSATGKAAAATIVAEAREDAERDGIAIRLPRGGQLPDRCIACNRPGVLLRRRIHQRVVFRPVWVGVLSIGMGLLAALTPISWLFLPVLSAAAAIGFVRTESRLLPIGLCGYHNWRRRLPLYVFLGFFVLLAVCGGIMSGALLARGMTELFFDIALAVGGLGVLVLLGCSILWVATGTPKLSIITVDRDYLWVGGAGAEFLGGLEPAQPRARPLMSNFAQNGPAKVPGAEHVNITA